jgi:hypothetical protein
MSVRDQATTTPAEVPAAGPYGLLIEFDSVDALIHAAARVRDAGYTKWDVYTPFPVHGLDQAMGIPRTRLPLIVFAAGLSGALGGLLLQWWTNAVDYPFVISGKPLFSLPANIPIIFELTILLAAFGAFFGMLALNGLPALYHSLFRSRRFTRVTTDRFFICIEAADPKYDPRQTRSLLASLGGEVEELED